MENYGRIVSEIKGTETHTNRERKKQMKKVFSNLLFGAVVFFVIWGLISWINIISQNSMPNPQYMNFNLFTLIF